MNKRTDILFLSHGGGPMPLLGDPDHREMVNSLEQFAAKMRQPDAILVISAHWEEAVPTITSGAAPGLIYDYYGFPPESYEIQYPSPGEPALAQQVCQALQSAGIAARLDEKRGYDHGMFVPLKVMYPRADIPCVQLSLVNNLDAETHLQIGRALQALDYNNLLVIGSGFSFHNMRAFFAPDTPDIRARNQAFEDWLLDTCVNPDIDEAERSRRFIEWERAPHAHFCHPREEHLLPLHVCYGMAGRPCDEHAVATILRKKSGLFRWSRAE
ncbi:dioxygenase [Marinobacterium sp. D7]|uniref:DODA-type extradiol aromatic ring-opening family dioxygenase n=1 Tax=Marinobacterium ramblicola TaxID=2849041 RepID=UPI001C2DE2B1|nr:class III extradiol ring-cleavage dioxygenase [Marinobacterium ramblicola]MBV1790284.1 dioxygenase [Marinobacterium ramblicola]